MRVRQLWVVPLTLASMGAVHAASTEWTVKPIIRLSPAKFPSLPASIKRELLRLGCTVPQPVEAEAPVNVVTGSFAAAGQKDYAVLCSKGGVSEIRVFWGGDARCPSPVPGSNRRDEDDTQTWTSESLLEYSREIGSASPKSMAEYQEYFAGNKAPTNDHDGIDDGFVGKGSTILYCHQGSWVELPGSD